VSPAAVPATAAPAAAARNAAALPERPAADGASS
jgi:hypothetical protein